MRQLKKILIVGGGTAGWMAAALLSKLFEGLYEITLIESEAIGIIGVGEATIPAIKKYNNLLGFDENDFMRKTQGSFKLGIQFVDWLKLGDSYIHGFGVIGRELGWLPCHQYWLQAQGRGAAADFSDYSINTAACHDNKFMRADPKMVESPLGHIGHAFHFDAALYSKFLRGLAEAKGVRRREGKVGDVSLRAEDGFVESVTMEDGEVIDADLFIDCSGFRGLIIEQALKTGYEDWTHWLPCDRAMAVPCARIEPFTPYTRATARTAGWQWRIPLQHRTGNGHVYSSRFIDDDDAERILLSNLDGEQLAEPNRLRFVTGKRKQVWNRNCVSLGLASGFLEPLESTSIHLIQSCLVRMVRLLPDASFNPATIAEFNRQTDFEYERIRDFIILHYKATERDDTEFWRHCRDMEVPATLQRKMDLWMSNGRVFREDDELFAEESWIQVLIGQGMIPRGYDPLVDIKTNGEIDEFLGNVRKVVGKCASLMPDHAAYVAKVCPAV
ncbi:tryptophan halogenase family protein [Brevundimonas sp. NPDC092305]|uniref:tryptophan halogenase family protein n=1 Tax=Brevundimonas sp. NPDC092305 TaxID=3363957 RepID=UPI00380E18A6